MGSQVVRRRRTAAVTGLVAALGLLTLAVVRGWWPVSVDRGLLGHLPGYDPSPVGRVALAVTQVIVDAATPEAWIVVSALVAAGLAWRTRSAAPVRLVVPSLVALALTVIGGKIVVARVGPGQEQVHHLLGSYPSGHTATAVVCVGLLGALATRGRPGQRRVTAIAAALWGALVAGSMVLHGYHWVTDVVAGFLLGGLILLWRDRVRAR